MLDESLHFIIMYLLLHLFKVQLILVLLGRAIPLRRCLLRRPVVCSRGCHRGFAVPELATTALLHGRGSFVYKRVILPKGRHRDG